MTASISTPKIRPATVAGGFYPAGAEELSATIHRLLSAAALKAAAPKAEGTIVAAVAPHAGYVFSGAVAAHTFAALKDGGFSRVVVLAPSHCASFGYSSVYDGDGYETPLGIVPVDTEFARRLAAMSPAIRLSDAGHEPAPGGGEHAIEVQLPWLQSVLGEFRLVPVIMGDHTYESSRVLGVALAKLVAGDRDPAATLVLASSDLSHYHLYDDARRMDAKTLQGLSEWDYLGMARNFRTQTWEACGGAAIIAAMIYAERMGADRAQVLAYRNSGDVNGDRSRVVGYSADVFVKSGQPAEPCGAFSLRPEEKTELLALARKAVETMVLRHELYAPPEPASAALNREAGAFVTLTCNGQLRGCVGYTSAIRPLYETVRDTATLAATRDSRFLPVGKDELAGIDYEISVLSPLRHVRDAGEIVVGRDGLLAKRGLQEGLLLPQVPVGRHWDRTQFLEQACVKASLGPDAWKDENTDIFRFTAIVFGGSEKLPSHSA